VTGRRGRRRRKLLDDLKERKRYSHLKEEALDRTMWRARFGRGFGYEKCMERKFLRIYLNVYRRTSRHRQKIRYDLQIISFIFYIKLRKTVLKIS